MKNKNNYVRHFHGLILALACLITVGGLLRGQASILFAQTPRASWSYTGSLNTARGRHTATLLPGGEVLVVGAYDASHTAEVDDPCNGRGRPPADINTAHVDHP